MQYRAMALVAASLLFATQCNAAPFNGSKSNTFKQTKQTGGNSTAKALVNNSKSNNFREDSTTSGGGAGKGDRWKGATLNHRGSATTGASGPANAATINSSKSNTWRMGGGGGGKGASGNAVKLNTSRSN